MTCIGRVTRGILPHLEVTCIGRVIHGHTASLMTYIGRVAHGHTASLRGDMYRACDSWSYCLT